MFQYRKLLAMNHIVYWIRLLMTRQSPRIHPRTFRHSLKGKLNNIIPNSSPYPPLNLSHKYIKYAWIPYVHPKYNRMQSPNAIIDTSLLPWWCARNVWPAGVGLTSNNWIVHRQFDSLVLFRIIFRLPFYTVLCVHLPYDVLLVAFSIKACRKYCYGFLQRTIDHLNGPLRSIDVNGE